MRRNPEARRRERARAARVGCHAPMKTVFFEWKVSISEHTESWLSIFIASISVPIRRTLRSRLARSAVA